MTSFTSLFRGDIDKIPPKSPPAARAYVKLWIAGIAGAYFTFLFRNLAFDLPTFDRSISDLPYTLSVLIRYVYLFWFLGYFFASNLPNEADLRRITHWHITFNMLQATAGFIAAYCLGFLTRGGTGFAHSIVTGIIGSNSAIGVICLVSLIFFGFRPRTGDETPRLNWLRFLALVTAGAAVIWVCGRDDAPSTTTLCPYDSVADNTVGYFGDIYPGHGPNCKFDSS